jgi:hypothetical protein
VRFLIDDASASTWSPSPENPVMKPVTSRMSPRRVERLECRALCQRRRFVLVTNNASDFRQLYAAQPLHAGLVILIPVVKRAVQQRLCKAALDELAVVGEPVNRVVEVDLDGEQVTLTLYDWPSAGT